MGFLSAGGAPTAAARDAGGVSLDRATARQRAPGRRYHGDVPDQLSLELPAALPNLPTGLRPMLPRPAPGPFDSADHLFEPSWGGRRALALVDWDEDGAARLRLLDQRGRDMAARLPELSSLVDLVVDLPAVLDGELVVPAPTGRADASALASRLSARAGPDVRATAIYLVFDLLYLAGRPLVGLPLARRRELLARAVRPSPLVVLVPAVVGAGRDLFDAAVAQGLPGLLARHLRSPYLAGRRSALWRSIDAASSTADAPGLPIDMGVEAPARPVLALLQRLPLDFT